jgi:hypothetical protein
MSRRAKIAHHEAGHAVIARVLGVEVAEIVMFRTAGTTAHVTTVSAAHLARDVGVAAFSAGLDHDIKVALAGPIAQHRYRPTKSIDSWVDDCARATNLAATKVWVTREERIPPEGGLSITLDSTEEAEAEAIFNASRSETETLVEAHWTAISRVAAAMQQKPLMNQTELDALIQGVDLRPIG